MKAVDRFRIGHHFRKVHHSRIGYRSGNPAREVTVFGKFIVLEEVNVLREVTDLGKVTIFRDVIGSGQVTVLTGHHFDRSPF